jgi:hypothetical protein
MIYLTTEYSRLTGLGNKLFPWALAKIFSRETGLPMLRQRWVSIRGGSIIRGGIDYSRIGKGILLFDNFCDLPEEVSTLRAFGLGRTVVKDLAAARQIRLDSLEGLIVFSAFSEHNFVELTPYREFLRNEFRRIVKRKWHLDTVTRLPERYVCMHIRWGNEYKMTDDPSVAYRKTPIEWFISGAQAIRSKGINLPIVIVSDGGPALLKFFAGIKGVTFSSSKSAAGDLLALMNADLILGSGPSSYSAWGAFMSGRPYFSCPSTPNDKYRLPPFESDPLDIKAMFSTQPDTDLPT